MSHAIRQRLHAIWFPYWPSVIASSKSIWWICFRKRTTWKALCTWFGEVRSGEMQVRTAVPISTDIRSRPWWRLFNNLNLCGVVILGRRPPSFRNHATCGLRIFFAHQQDHPAEAGKRILHQRRRSKITVDTRRIEQSLHHQRLRLLLRLEHLHQFLVGIRTRLRVAGRIAFCHGHLQFWNRINDRLRPCTVILHFLREGERDAPAKCSCSDSSLGCQAAAKAPQHAAKRSARVCRRKMGNPTAARNLKRHFCVVALLRKCGRMALTKAQRQSA